MESILEKAFLVLHFCFSRRRTTKKLFPIASPPWSIVPVTWHEHSFLDSHSARQRIALKLPAKTPYLCPAAFKQDGGVRVTVEKAGEGKGYRKRYEMTWWMRIYRRSLNQSNYSV